MEEAPVAITSREHHAGCEPQLRGLDRLVRQAAAMQVGKGRGAARLPEAAGGLFRQDRCFVQGQAGRFSRRPGRRLAGDDGSRSREGGMLPRDQPGT